jgi:hypothetical protein
MAGKKAFPIPAQLYYLINNCIDCYIDSDTDNRTNNITDNNVAIVYNPRLLCSMSFSRKAEIHEYS